MGQDDKKLVYSTDPKDQIKINPPKISHQEGVDLSKLVVIFRLEKSGRGGKTVTVLDGFPKNLKFLEDFTKELKSKCGTGGKCEIGEKHGLIEIQGDKRDVLKKILATKAIKFKGM